MSDKIERCRHNIPIAPHIKCPECNKEDLLDAFYSNNTKILFWTCPNGCNDFIDWDHSTKPPVATCRKCGASNGTSPFEGCPLFKTKDTFEINSADDAITALQSYLRGVVYDCPLRKNNVSKIEKELLMDTWNQFSIEVKNKNGEISKVAGGLSTLEEIYDYLLKHNLINEKGQING